MSNMLNKLENKSELKKLKKLIDNCSPKTLQLAKVAAKRQRAKTATDIDIWTKQIIQDVKNTDD